MMQLQHAIEPQRPCRTGSPHWAGPQRRSPIHPLTTTELQAYQQNGFLLIRSVFSPREIDIFQREAHRMADHATQLTTRTFVGIERGKCHHSNGSNTILSDFMHNSIKQKTETTPLPC